MSINGNHKIDQLALNAVKDFKSRSPDASLTTQQYALLQVSVADALRLYREDLMRFAMEAASEGKDIMKDWQGGYYAGYSLLSRGENRKNSP